MDLTRRNTIGDGVRRAAELYRGDLLAGLGVDETPFEEWLLGERERLRELALEGLAKLLAQQRKDGMLEPAVQTTLRLLMLSVPPVFLAWIAWMVLMAIDRTHVQPTASLAGAREVAFFPPVTGG